MDIADLQKVQNIIDNMVESSGNDGLTVSQLFDKTYEGHWKRIDTQWSREAVRVYNTAIKDKIGSTPATKLARKDVKKWHAKIGGYSANRALSVLSKMFSFGIEEDLVFSNPCQFVKPFPETKRTVYATPDQIIKIDEILKRNFPEKKAAVTLLYCLMYTAARPSVFLRAKVDNLSTFEKDGRTFGLLKVEGKSFRKTGTFETYIIPPQAMFYLDQLPKTALDRKLIRCSTPKKLWAKIVKEAGCPNLWMRDFRRTFATTALSSGESLDVIGEVLNHKSRQTTLIYAKLTDEKRIEAVSNVANVIYKIASG